MATSYAQPISANFECALEPYCDFQILQPGRMLKARHNGRCGESTTRVMTEVLTSIKRAGADLIITYFALEFAEGSRR